MERGFDPFEEPYVDPAERERATVVLSGVNQLPGVSGSLIFRERDGTIVSQLTLPAEIECPLSFAIWSLGIFIRTQNQITEFGYPMYQQLLLRSPEGFVILVNMEDQILEIVTPNLPADELALLSQRVTELLSG